MRFRSPLPCSAAALAASLLLATACAGDDPATGSEAASAETAAQDADQDAAPAEITVTHAQGETTIPASPQTVVAFDPGSIVTLTDLGIELAGTPQLNDPPEALARYGDGSVPVVGTLFEPDFEQVNALEPDLIIVGGRSSDALDELSNIAPTIDLSVDNTDLVAGIRERAETLGEIFGVEDQVEAELAEIDATIARIQDLAPDAGDALIVQTSGGEVSAYGPGSRFGVIHGEFGLASAAPSLDDEANHGDTISFEFILEAEPDHLFVLDRDAATSGEGEAALQILDNELVEQTPAWQNDAVHVMPPFEWYIAPSGLSSLATMVAFVESALT